MKGDSDGDTVTLHSGTNAIVASLGGKMHLYLEIVI